MTCLQSTQPIKKNQVFLLIPCVNFQLPTDRSTKAQRGNSSSTCPLASCPKSVPALTSPKPRIAANSSLVAISEIHAALILSSAHPTHPNAKYYEWCISKSSLIHLLFSITTALAQATDSRNFSHFTFIMVLINGSSTLQPEGRFCNTDLIFFLT